MKRIFIFIGMLLPGFLFIACEKEIRPYEETINRLNFKFEGSGHSLSSDTLISYSLLYTPRNQNTDTIWVEVATVGYVTDYPRKVSFEQVPSSGEQAIAGTHYIAFNDPRLSEAYFIPAHKNSARLPIVLIKDPSLDDKEVSLKIRIAENEFFQSGFSSYQAIHIKVTNRIVKPKYWDSHIEYYITGYTGYGKQKHLFMIEVGREHNVLIDEDWFKNILGSDRQRPDMGVTNYWNLLFRNALRKKNEELGAAGPLREAPDINHPLGEIVDFTLE